ncbi:Uu.00g014520.m01.CDS01 [Anthostomella pinea]|uniref:Uu.00g014520.m01.CDS01 n=1 Tax=Anthostomella pinea TaxID=933095 RepID=A0AAI8VZK1_9PEZI|nr:Uu.00g014520.m01.CDS01 [Anthostomella pinea]
MALPFVLPSRKGDAWFFTGLTSSFPNITESGSGSLYEPQECDQVDATPGCKVFHVSASDSSQARQIEGDDMISHDGAALQDQVLVFQYRGKFHAVDNVSTQEHLPELLKGRDDQPAD